MADLCVKMVSLVELYAVVKSTIWGTCTLVYTTLYFFFIAGFVVIIKLSCPKRINAKVTSHYCTYSLRYGVFAVLPYISYITGDISILSSNTDLTPAHRPSQWDTLTVPTQASWTAGAFNQWEQSRKEVTGEGKGWSWIFHGCSAGLHGDDVQSGRSFKVTAGWQLGAHRQSKGEVWLHLFTWAYL